MNPDRIYGPQTAQTPAEILRNADRFNVSRVAKASYIVRVVTAGRQVYYLKLVKQ